MTTGIDRAETPSLELDIDVLESNIRRAAAEASHAGLALRPHAKTHKAVEVARRQLDAGAVGLTLATVSEAEVFADAGVSDIFIAYPLWPSDSRIARLRSLSERVRLRIGVDSADAAERFGRALAGAPIEVVVEVDSGHHRSGLAPQDAGALAVAAERAGLRVVGVFTFPGHGYSPEARVSAARDEASAIEQAAAELARHGIDAGVRSGGSTPTRAGADSSVLTEVRPGVYVFNDAQQLELGSCGLDEVALWARSTVVSARGRDIIVDAGSKTLGADRPSWASGFGRVLEHPDAVITALSEHHATVRIPDSVAVPALGDQLRVVPNHVCSAVNLADELVVTREGRAVDAWRVAARGANT